MNVGDLVNFDAGSSWILKGCDEEYKSPGIILEKKCRNNSTKRFFMVMWADGKVTTEFESYLKQASM